MQPASEAAPQSCSITVQLVAADAVVVVVVVVCFSLFQEQ